MFFKKKEKIDFGDHVEENERKAYESFKRTETKKVYPSNNIFSIIKNYTDRFTKM